MKLQSASRKEIARIAGGTGVLDLILIAVLFIMSQFGIGTFSLVKILISALCGSVVAIVNFTIMCLTIQNALGMEDMQRMKAKFTLSYNARMVIQSVWIVAALMLPGIHFIAGAAPVFFPKLTILHMQLTGKIPPSDRPPSATDPEQPDNPNEE